MWIKLRFFKKLVGAAYIQVRSIDRKLRYSRCQSLLSSTGTAVGNNSASPISAILHRSGSVLGAYGSTAVISAVLGWVLSKTTIAGASTV